jgi:hypothetical protein
MPPDPAGHTELRPLPLPLPPSYILANNGLHNLSHIELDDNTKHVLSLGLRFVPKA